MPFVKVRPVTTSSPFDVQCANQLQKIVTHSKNRRNRWSRTQWSNEFRILRGELTNADPEKRIQTALDWFKVHCTKPGVPPINSGRGFRKYFDWLEDLIKRDKVLQIEISDEAKYVSIRCQMKRWPKASRDQLDVTIELTLRRVKEILVARTYLASQLTKDPVYRSFLNLVQSKIGSPAAFAERWMMSVHKSIKDWKEWNGKLTDKAFSLGDRQFQNNGKGWSVEYSGTTKLWNRFIKDLQECK